jgi:nucleotide-binding universal stress UspA family protein
MKILLAIDGSRHAREAIRLLRTLAARRDFDVEVVAVVPPEMTPVPESAFTPESRVVGTSVASPATVPGAVSVSLGDPPVLNPRLEDQVPSDVARAWLADAEADLAAAGLRVRTELLCGTPEEALVDRCREGGHDLVVAGVKGRGATPFFELGRVATHLVRWSPASVLLVRKRAARRPLAPETGSPDAQGFRILLPTDGHAACLEASRRLVEALSPDQAMVDLVNVEEPSRGVEELSRASDTPRRWLSQAAGDLAWGRTRTRSNVLRGRPAAAIARWASASETDLVVLGTEAPRGSTASRLGRTGRELAWSSPCSVLMVRS